MLLAIDSSSTTASIAILNGGTLIAEYFMNNGLTHSHTLAPMLDAALKNSGVKPADIKQVVVTNGPGSFTGLRIGAATALGFATALGIPCAGVSTLMAAAYGAADRTGTICAALDARRGEVYCALFSAAGDINSLSRKTEDEAIGAKELLEKIPEGTIWTGDAARLYARPSDAIISRPNVSGYGAASCFINGHHRPAAQIVYLRKPQAERERPGS